MSRDIRIVNYAVHCKTCRHLDLDGTEEPCNECLAMPVNEHTEKPVNYEEKEKDA